MTGLRAAAERTACTVAVGAMNWPEAQAAIGSTAALALTAL